jgi:peptidyl-prolyl cis-trans isomerase C
MLSVLFSPGSLAQPVIEDQGVDMSREEVGQVVQRWPAEMQRAAANDLGDRMELLNQALANKKIALEAEKLTPESDPEAYWEYRFMIQQVQGKFVFDRYMDELEVPDMSALAQERYETQKDKYALVKERRLSSHILFAC